MMEKQLIEELIINSPEFRNNDYIPSKYTCDGDNVNPPLEISGIPDKAITLVLIVEDLDSPKGIFDHWIVWNIQKVKSIAENIVPGIQGKNSFGRNQYDDPCPSSGTHRYYFKLYALDAVLELPEGSGKIALPEAMNGHLLTVNELMGRYETKK